jgi:hypothetical protein
LFGSCGLMGRADGARRERGSEGARERGPLGTLASFGTWDNPKQQMWAIPTGKPGGYDWGLESWDTSLMGHKQQQ